MKIHRMNIRDLKDHLGWLTMWNFLIQIGTAPLSREAKHLMSRAPKYLEISGKNKKIFYLKS